MAAFARQRIGPITLFSLAGYYWPFRSVWTALEASDQITGTRAIAAALTDHSPSVGLRFGPISGSDTGVRMLLAELVRLGWHGLCKTIGEAYVLALHGDAESTFQQASRGMLKNVRYLRRRLEREHGEVSSSRHAFDARDDSLLQILEAVETASWVHKSGGETKFVGERNQGYWRAIARSPRKEALAVVWLLYSGEKPISFSLNIETESTVYVVANSFDEAWNRFSPGSILAAEVITDASQRGFQKLDWGQGDSGYKSKWGATSGQSILDVLLLRPGILGRCAGAVARRKLPDWRTFEQECLLARPTVGEDPGFHAA